MVVVAATSLGVICFTEKLTDAQSKAISSFKLDTFPRLPCSYIWPYEHILTVEI
jgi:hypothetical protein